MDLRKE
jgi:hypothetical protein